MKLRLKSLTAVLLSALLLSAMSTPPPLTSNAEPILAWTSGDDDLGEPDCVKAMSGDPNLCDDPGDRNDRCKTMGANSNCQNCPAGTNETTRKDPNLDGCCCDWGTYPID